MSIRIQMELCGSESELSDFKELQSEIYKRDYGQLQGIADVDRIAFEWIQSLEVYESNERIVYTWRSHLPQRFVASLAERYPEITVVNSIINLDEQLIGTYALRGSKQIASSWAPNSHVVPRRPGTEDIEDDDLLALISQLDEEDPIQEISTVHYQRAIEILGLQPIGRQFADTRVWRSPAWQPALDDWRRP